MHAYRDAGVDIDRGDRFVEFIKRIPSAAVDKGIGGFSSALPLDGFRSPVLMTTTDGTGNKAPGGEEAGNLRHDRDRPRGYERERPSRVRGTAHGVPGLHRLRQDPRGAHARPHSRRRARVRAGGVQAWRRGTAEMPGTRTARMISTWRALPSGLRRRTPFCPERKRSGGRCSWGFPRQGSTPTVFPLREKSSRRRTGGVGGPARSDPHLREGNGGPRGHAAVLAAAHITGGGLVGNLTRVMPAGLSPSFSFDWEEPPVFKRIRGAGVSEDEMRKVFNLGIGVALIAHDSHREELEEAARRERFQLQVIGTIE